MSVLDVLMCGWVGCLYLLTVYSMCAYVGGGGGLYLLSVYSAYAYVWEGWWSISTLCILWWGGLYLFSIYLCLFIYMYT